MSARERILARLARTQRGGGDTGGPLPPASAGGAVVGHEPHAAFLSRARRLGSDVLETAAAADVPRAVAEYLQAHGAPLRAVVWPQLAALPWHSAGLDAEARAARGDDPAGITGAFAAIAETGTLMLLSGPATPASVSLLPETHVAIVRRGQVVATMEEAWARMRAQLPAPPRAVNFVSGPSRTADVEQTITVGAHGPRRVLIVLAPD